MPYQSIQADNGGRPAANDDFLVLQSQAPALGLPALLQGIGPCVVSGCRVWQTGTVWNVGAGMVWDGANLLPFPGQSNVSLPAMFQPGQVVMVDERAYQTGGTKTTIKGQSMDLVPVVAGASNLVLDVNGAITFWQRVQERTREVGTVEYITDLTGYDGTGLGYGAKRGWGLCNGQGGRVDLRGQFVAGYDPATAAYDTVGKTGGEAQHTLTNSEMPNHAHTLNITLTDSGGQVSNTTTAMYGSPGAFTSGRPTMQAVGGNEPHENRPPFYVLAARQWMGF